MGSSRERIVLEDEKRGQRFVLPVNPPRISVSDGRSFTEVPIVGLGVALLNGPMKPQELQIASFFPRYYDESFCNYSQLAIPEDSIEKIIFWMGRTSGQVQQVATPLRVTITGTPFSQLMVITDFQHEYAGGEPDAVYFDMTLRQWRRQRVRVEEAGSGSASSSTSDKRQTPPLSGRTYTVKKGDTLWALAKKYYGSGSKWSTIYEANKAVIGSNPNLIYPGQVFVIP